MKNLKELQPVAEVLQAVDVELNEEQLDVVSGGAIPNFTLMASAIDQIIKYEKEGK